MITRLGSHLGRTRLKRRGFLRRGGRCVREGVQDTQLSTGFPFLPARSHTIHCFITTPIYHNMATILFSRKSPRTRAGDTERVSATGGALRPGGCSRLSIELELSLLASPLTHNSLLHCGRWTGVVEELETLMVRRWVVANFRLLLHYNANLS